MSTAHHKPLVLIASLLLGCSAGSSSTPAAGGDQGAGGAATGQAGAAPSTGGSGGKVGTGGSGKGGQSAAATGGAGAAGSPNTGSPKGSSGCGKDISYDTSMLPNPGWRFWGLYNGGTKDLSLTLANRAYGLYIPSSYNKNTPMPLVWTFGGCGSPSGEPWPDMQGVVSASKDSVLYVQPRKSADCWDTSSGGGDLRFIDQLLQDIESRLCVRTDAIFAYGFSSGGYMSNAVGCYRGDVFRAVAPQSGGPPGPWVCKGPMPVLAIHGEADPVVAISQGQSARDYWVKANGCKSTTTPWSMSPCVSYDGCKEGKPVVWCPIPGLGHDIWGGSQNPPTAGVAIWSFFKQYL